MRKKVEMEYAGRPLSIETGRVAKQSHGAVWMQYGETIVLVATVSDTRPSDFDFFRFKSITEKKCMPAGASPAIFLSEKARLQQRKIARAFDRSPNQAPVSPSVPI